VAALRNALANRDLARLLGAFAAASLGSWAFMIALSLYAYTEGGASAVGIAVLVRMAPSAVAAPYGAMLADRHSRRNVLAHKPAQAALIPQPARTPVELAAANVCWSTLDSAGFVAGSLLVGILVAATALGGLAGALLVAPLGVRWAIVLTGLALPAVAIALRARMSAFEAQAEVAEAAFGLLRRLNLFSSLPVAMIENLAVRAQRGRFGGGADIVTPGAPADGFYVIEEGRVDVFVDGVLRRAEGPGEYSARSRCCGAARVPRPCGRWTR
jgi:hypothetical protein